MVGLKYKNKPTQIYSNWQKHFVGNIWIDHACRMSVWYEQMPVITTGAPMNHMKLRRSATSQQVCRNLDIKWHQNNTILIAKLAPEASKNDKSRNCSLCQLKLTVTASHVPWVVDDKMDNQLWYKMDKTCKALVEQLVRKVSGHLVMET